MKTRIFPIKKLFAVITIIFLSCLFPNTLHPQESDSLNNRYQSLLFLMGEDRYEEAITGLQHFIGENPAFQKTYKKLAETFIFTGDLEGGQSYFEELLQEDPDNAYAYYGLARMNLEKEEYEKAIENLKKCITLDPSIAEAYSSNGGLSEAYMSIEASHEAYQFFQSLVEADSTNACAYYGLASNHIDHYEIDKALEMLNKSLQIDPGLIRAYGELAFCYGITGKYQKVLEISEILLTMAENRKDLDWISYANDLMGNAHFYMGNYWKALHHFNESLNIYKMIGDKQRIASLVGNLGSVYSTLGDYSRALEYFKAALSFARNSSDILAETLALTNMGVIHTGQGNDPKALEIYGQALNLAKENNLKHEESFILANMGVSYESLKNYDKAIDIFKQALKIAREINDKGREGHALLNLGYINVSLGRDADAITYCSQALNIAAKNQDIQTIWEAQIGLGDAYRNQNDRQKAVSHYAKAIAIYDTVRANLGIESLGSGFLEYNVEVYPPIIQLLAEDGKFAEAFAYAEKYKAQTLLRILSSAQFQLEGLLPDSLRIQLGEIKGQLEELHGQVSEQRSLPEKDQDKIIDLDRQITELELQQSAITDHVKENYGSYYKRTTSEPLELSEIQSTVLDGGQALIEYVVGSEELSVFVIRADSVMYHSIEITKDTLMSKLADLSPLFRQQKDTDVQLRLQVLNSQLANFSVPPAHALYEILIQPIEPFFSAADELIIVPDDVLFYLPFEILIVDTTGIENRYSFDKATFLIEKYSISYSASASLLDPRLQRPRSSTQGILALGNPDFGKQEDEPLWTSSFAYSGGIVRGNRFVSLPNSETEVKAVDNVLSGVRNSIYTGNRATEDVFKKQAGHFKILHLATHFLSDDRQPLYSRLVLSQTRNQQEDGYLQPYEIFNMNLNADLAVLSACNTGLGKLSRGEGIVGISRAFMYAGVPSLVVSLWSVDDKATSEIMKSFYKHLQIGLNKKQALRQAKIEYLNTASGNSNDPFYWAPFILIGDWSPVELPTRGISNWWIAFIVIILLVVGITLFVKNRMRMLRAV